MGSGFTFTDRLSKSCRQDLEQLFFFNPQQHRHLEPIVRMVEAFGQPALEVQGDSVGIVLADHPDAACLYALDHDRLAGVALIAQFKPDTLSVLHIAIDPAYTLHGDNGHRGLMNAMLEELKRMAKKRHTVERITIGYTRGDQRHLEIPVA
ncbi:hypothetical protein JW948_02220 [bacterium]|nr:hypothetical protein [bacterium]